MRGTDMQDRIALASTLVLLGLIGCATTPEPALKSGADLVAQAKTRIVEVEPAAVAIRDGAIIIDVREPGEFEQGHIPGAINVPRGVLEFRIDGIEPLQNLSQQERLSRPLVLYCRSGSRSALATATLGDMGYRNVRSLSGGFKAWQAAELPVSTP